MRSKFLLLFLFLFSFASLSAQLYDSRGRYLQRKADDFEKVYKPRTLRTTTPRSYTRYRSRTSNYNRRGWSPNQFYNRYREPRAYVLYANNPPKSETGLNDCHCNVRFDVHESFQLWYNAQEQAREDLLRSYEALFEKKIEKILNKQFPDFQSAQREFFKEYTTIADKYNVHKNKISPFVQKDYTKHFNIHERNTAFYNVARQNMSHATAKHVYQDQYTRMANSSEDYLISRKLLYLLDFSCSILIQK